MGVTVKYSAICDALENAIFYYEWLQGKATACNSLDDLFIIQGHVKTAMTAFDMAVNASQGMELVRNGKALNDIYIKNNGIKICASILERDCFANFGAFNNGIIRDMAKRHVESIKIDAGGCIGLMQSIIDREKESHAIYIDDETDDFDIYAPVGFAKGVTYE